MPLHRAAREDAASMVKVAFLLHLDVLAVTFLQVDNKNICKHVYRVAMRMRASHNMRDIVHGRDE